MRCAIYTRKSSEDGLEQDFNSLDAQREACEAFIRSQVGEGWRVISERFDDGGYSGGNTDRPALTRLLERVKARQIDIIVLYKIDRLTRSLTDFARLAELFDKEGVSFVSVTQQFNTTNSMGRLMLNVLLSFAQFEREITGERIRDKILASKKKGMWMGGTVPLGYDVKDRHLVVNPIEAETVSQLYRLFLQYGDVKIVAKEAEALGFQSKKRISAAGHETGGGPIKRNSLYRLLTNPMYIGRMPHKKEDFAGLHDAIIDLDIWHAVQNQFRKRRAEGRSIHNVKHDYLLRGLLEDPAGNRFFSTYAVKSGRRYRYYVKVQTINDQNISLRRTRFPAHDLEMLVIGAIRLFLARPDQVLSVVGGSLSGTETNQVVSQAQALIIRLNKASSAQWISILPPILQRIVIDQNLVRIAIKRASLRQLLQMPASEADAGIHELTVPLDIRLRGQQMKLILRNDHVEARADLTLVKAITQAQHWFDQLKSGTASSIDEIAKAEGITGSYVTRILRLAFLAPDIIEAILTGRQPADLTTRKLTLKTDLPMDWNLQRKLLGTMT